METSFGNLQFLFLRNMQNQRGRGGGGEKLKAFLVSKSQKATKGFGGKGQWMKRGNTVRSASYDVYLGITNKRE